MTDLFRNALAFVLQAEGGYGNDPRDPGQATNHGVSLRAVVALDVDKDGFLDFDLDHDGDVDAEDIKALDQHPDLVDEFYRQRYWTPMRASEMPWPWYLLAFDAAVNHGPAAATLMLQRALRVIADGIPGLNTVAATRGGDGEPVRRFWLERADLYYRLSVKRGPSMYRGWMGRLFDLEARVCEGEFA